MATAWLTYSWVDNANRDIHFVVQELQGVGLTVKLDRWTIGAGRPLWDQIEEFITNPALSDAWVLYATQNSLRSEPCREEYRYALDRALRNRSSSFPVIALFPSTTDPDLIPAGIRVRLHVSITDPDWKERIKAAAEGRMPNVTQGPVQPYAITLHKSGHRHVVEVRPRAGTWSPFVAGVPIAEKDAVNISLYHGPSGRIPRNTVLTMARSGTSNDGKWWMNGADNEATPTQSYFIFCDQLPSRLVFGISGGPTYEVPLTDATSSVSAPHP